MGKVFVLMMVGFLAGLCGAAPTYGGAEGRGDDPQIRIAQQQQEKPRAGGERGPRVHQDADEWRTAWQGLSPENRAALHQAWKNAAEKVKGLTPEQKRKMAQAADQMAAKLKNLSPEQKAALQQQLQKSAQTYESLTAEQKQAILTDLAGSLDKMGMLTPEKKAQLLAQYGRLLGR